MKRWQDGRTIASLALHGYHRKAYGSPFWDIHRHDLIMALYERAAEQGAQIQTNAKVVDVDFDAGTVRLKNGDPYTADLVVGADGLNSLCRQRFVPTEQPEFTGDMAFRVLLNVDDLPADDAEFRELANNPQCTYWLGPNGHAIVYILKGGRQINLVAVALDDLPAGVIRAPCQVEDVLKIFRDWDPLYVRAILKQIPSLAT